MREELKLRQPILACRNGGRHRSSGALFVFQRGWFCDGVGGDDRWRVDGGLGLPD